MEKSERNSRDLPEIPAAAGSLLVPRLYGAVLAVLAVAFLGGGIWLAAVGGSLYYLLAGATLAVCAVLLWKGLLAGMELYFLFYALTIVWSIWEAGLRFWPLLPRLAMFTVIALLMALPAFRRNLRSGGGRVQESLSLLSRAAVLMPVMVIAVVLGSGLRQLRDLPPDPAFTVKASPELQPSRIQLPEKLAAGDDWTEWGGDKAGRRFSALSDITPANVSGLEVAWTYHVGANPDGANSSLAVTPLKVGDSIYLCTPFNDIVALDAETGAERWRYQANARLEGVFFGNCRGVAYHAAEVPTEDCAERILANTVDSRVLAVDARTGEACRSFGEGGSISLLKDMGDVLPGYYYGTSAPVIANGKIVVGGLVRDNEYVGEPSGVIRAFDAVTGEFAWAFDIGRPGEHGEPAEGETYTPATPNVWAPMSVDEELGLVYAPTGNATPDLYGGHRRPFDDEISSSVIALDIETGALRWVFQTTHHDLWDYDVPSQPTLVDLPVSGGVAHALIQPTKRGDIFLLDRVTGEPLTLVEELPVATDGVPGEAVSPTQPFSTGMPSVSGPRLTENMMWGITPFDQLYCRIQFLTARYHGPLTPPTERPYILYPGFLGGTNWGSSSVDPLTRVMVVNSSRLAARNFLIPREEADRMGVTPTGMSDTVIQQSSDSGGVMAAKGTPFAMATPPFLSPLGAPCQEPPYGMLTAVDLDTKQVVWSKPLGTAYDSGIFGIPARLPIPLGTPNTGGSLVTASGLVFIAGTQERAIRAVDITTGDILWKARLPAGGHATPMTYRSAESGRQFVVVAAGGNYLLQSGYSDEIIAYALPSNSN